MVIRRLVLIFGLTAMLCSSGCFHRRWCCRPRCQPCCPAPACCESSFSPGLPPPALAGPGPLTPIPAKATVQVYEGR
ncbi:MAG: hypothetical protein ACJ8FY_25225 [Gemmataceae bacterium]